MGWGKSAAGEGAKMMETRYRPKVRTSMLWTKTGPGVGRGHTKAATDPDTRSENDERFVILGTIVGVYREHRPSGLCRKDLRAPPVKKGTGEEGEGKGKVSKGRAVWGGSKKTTSGRPRKRARVTIPLRQEEGVSVKKGQQGWS